MAQGNQIHTIDAMREALRDVVKNTRKVSRDGRGMPIAVPVEPEVVPALPATLENVNPAFVVPEIDEPTRGNLAPGARHDFIFAGNALFTIQSPSGTRFTYKVTRSKPDPSGRFTSPVWFVKCLTGPANTGDYSYIGTVFATGFRTTKNSRFDMQAPCVRAFAWFSVRLTDPRIDVWHEGRCGRCGRVLTVPSSIEAGLGPECASKGD